MNKYTQKQSDSLFAQGTDETRRLRRQADFLSRYTRYLLDSAGITSGMKVLDVGTSIGDVAFLVAERVGPQGTVVDVDMNPAMIDFARQRAQATVITNTVQRCRTPLSLSRRQTGSRRSFCAQDSIRRA